MPPHIRRGNASRSSVRAGIEHVFAQQKGPMDLCIRTIGIVRAKVKIGLGARPALVLLEVPNDSPTRPEVFDRLVALGKSAGLPVLDLQGLYADIADRSTLWIAPWDGHTNAKGHRLLAGRLYPLLVKERLVPTDSQADGSRGG
jgi:hypothetical protein